MSKKNFPKNFTLIPAVNFDQQLRIKRFLMAGFSYLIFLALVLLCQQIGIFRLSITEFFKFTAFVLSINLFFYFLFRFEINTKFKDKSLTIPQMSVAILIIMVTIYFIDHVRGVFLLLYMVAFSFGIFRLKTRQFLVLAVLVIASYIFVVGLMHKSHPERTDLQVEFIRVIVLCFVFTWLSFLGGYIHNLQKKVEELATRDELTKLFNRRSLFKILEREICLAKRKHAPFCIIMIDIDDFKKINDTFGHQSGDKVLYEVASNLKSSLRRCDYIGRYGGEEFLLILSYPTLRNALICCERLRSIIQGLKIDFNGEKIEVTISMGATIYFVDESIDKTLARADKALYRAKSNGKNRTEFEKCP